MFVRTEPSAGLHREPVQIDPIDAASSDETAQQWPILDRRARRKLSQCRQGGSAQRARFPVERPAGSVRQGRRPCSSLLHGTARSPAGRPGFGRSRCARRVSGAPSVLLFSHSSSREPREAEHDGAHPTGTVQSRDCEPRRPRRRAPADDSPVDQFDTLELGANTAIASGSGSDSLLALLPETGEWVVPGVPDPLGLFARRVDGRIGAPDGDWKGWGQAEGGRGWQRDGSERGRLTIDG